MKDMNLYIQKTRWTSKKLNELQAGLYQDGQITGRQTNDLESTKRREMTCHADRILSKTNNWFLTTPRRPESSGMIYSKCWKENTVSKNYPSKMKDKLRYTHINKKGETLALADLV